MWVVRWGCLPAVLCRTVRFEDPTALHGKKEAACSINMLPVSTSSHEHTTYIGAVCGLRDKLCMEKPWPGIPGVMLRWQHSKLLQLVHMPSNNTDLHTSALETLQHRSSLEMRCHTVRRRQVGEVSAPGNLPQTHQAIEFSQG